MYERDAANSMKLGDIVRQKLQECAACHGEGLHASLAALDSTVALQLQKVVATDLTSTSTAPGYVCSEGLM